jgi:hypothetical protein
VVFGVTAALEHVRPECQPFGVTAALEHVRPECQPFGVTAALGHVRPECQPFDRVTSSSICVTVVSLWAN